jgi:1-acyl-sn-glycerol-3-phosphate acyltransferase
VWDARWKVVCLWWSQVARVTADNALRFFLVLELYKGYGASAWYLVTTLLMVPAVVLAPLNGAIGNSLPKPAVLLGSAGWMLVVTGLGAASWYAENSADDLLPYWALLAIGAAIYGPTRYALLPAAADDTRWALTRLNGLFEMGAALAVVAGMILALGLDSTTLGAHHLPALVAVLGGGAFLFALPVRFASDVRRPEAALQAVRSFFADAASIWAARETRVCLVGLALLRGIVTGLTGALLPRLLTSDTPNRGQLLAACAWIGWLMAGLALGSLLAGLQRHPRRVLGLVPWGATGLVAGLIWAASGDIPAPALLVIFGVMAGLVNVPLAATYQADLPADARGNGMAVRNFADYFVVALTSLILYLLAGPADEAPAVLLILLAAGCGLAAVYAWFFFRREVVELLLEALFLVMYRFRTAGPGLETFPVKGPLLVVANHSTWTDPLLLGKVVPRSIVAMMTSLFYDPPVMRWLMVHMARAIRVQASTYRREAPELQEAIAALDQGECVLIFPEGSMRKKLERPLRMFGQGVWHILSERPNTPVVVCWIEGGWGSFFSYQGGKPTKNKRFDLFHPIGVAVGAPHRLPPEVLADQRATRLALMRECLEMRGHLGLEVYALEQDAEEEELTTEAQRHREDSTEKTDEETDEGAEGKTGEKTGEAL